MSELQNNRLVRTFADLRAQGKHALLPFITAGYPDLETTEALLHEFERRGARICELGIPFSDPVADGPVIQASYTRALDSGITCAKIFDAVRRYRAAGGQLALVAMVSYSIVFRRGVDAWLHSAREADFDATIIPDLSLEEAGTVEAAARSEGLANILLIAPNTPPERRYRIAEHSRGFIYYMSVTGITGERDRLPEVTVEGVRDLRGHTDTPICVGFGISTPPMVRTVCDLADGAIVGSAIVRRIDEAHGLPREQLVERVGAFVGELLEPVR